MPSQSSTGLPVICTTCDFPGILFKTPVVVNFLSQVIFIFLLFQLH